MPPTEHNVFRGNAGLHDCGTQSRRLGGLLRARLAVLLVLASTVAAHAELRWDNSQQTIALRTTDAVGTACFAFTNTGANPVTITDVHAGCGCTVPMLAKNTYAPGERGELRVDFHPGGREGLQQIPISVQTDDAAETAALLLVVRIETVVAFDTKYLFWKGAEPRTPKVMRLTFAKDLPAELAGVQCANPQFAAVFRSIGDTGLEYEIVVTPPADVRNYTAITVKILIGAEKAARNFTVVARTF